jgi:hypothetical protein
MVELQLDHLDNAHAFAKMDLQENGALIKHEKTLKMNDFIIYGIMNL